MQAALCGPHRAAHGGRGGAAPRAESMCLQVTGVITRSSDLADVSQASWSRTPRLRGARRLVVWSSLLDVDALAVELKVSPKPLQSISMPITLPQNP